MMFSQELEALLGSAKSIAILTGAGISAESGVPTFRSPEGLWAKYNPMELATYEAFTRDPNLVWRWYSYRRKTIAAVEPNPGHYALVELQNLVSDFSLITQNVDNLHRRAGSRDVHELHGNIERSFCLKCKRVYQDDEAPPAEQVQQCECGGLIRPDVVWFGETLPQDELNFASEAASRADLFFSIGTSGQVYPAAQLPGIARERGAYVVEINTERTPISWEMNEVLTGPSGTILPALVAAASRQRSSA